MRALVVANSGAAEVSRESVEEVAARLGGAEIAWTEPDAPAPVGMLTKRLASPPDLVVTVGGDGSVRVAAEAIARARGAWPTGDDAAAGPALAVVPLGSGNSAYTAIWGERPWEAVLDAASSADPPRRMIDLVRIEDPEEATFLGINLGLIAEVAAAVLEKRESDPDAPREEQYGGAFVEVTSEFDPFPAVVTVDGETVHDGPTTFVSIGGVRAFGGGMLPLLPRAEIDDGLLDVCVVAGAESREKFNEVAMAVATGDHIDREGVQYRQGRAVEVERTDGEPLVVEHDGDPRPAAASLRAAIVPRAVPVVAPAADA